MPHAVGSRWAHRGGPEVTAETDQLRRGVVAAGAIWLVVLLGTPLATVSAQNPSTLTVASAGDADLELVAPNNARVSAVTRSFSDITDTASLKPMLRGNLPFAVRRKLTYAFALAVERVRDVDTCGELFARLDSNGVERFAVNRYVAASWVSGASGCQPGVVAFSFVGSPQTRLCEGFARLGTEEAVMTLIHEALHTAGMTEWPSDPEAIRSEEIQRLVKRSCGRHSNPVVTARRSDRP